MNPHEIAEKTKTSLLRSLRSASVASLEVSGQECPITSSFGGGFYLVRGEHWPTINNNPLLPILQIRIDELPYVHSSLKDYKLVQVFVAEDFYPDYDNTASGSNWLLKTYTSLDDLSVATYPGRTDLKHHSIRWNLAQNEAPNLDDLGAAIGHELNIAFRELDSEYKEWFYDDFDRASATKVGGWTEWIQNSVTDDAVIQIETEKNANWAWPGGGFACIYFNEELGGWQMWVDLP